MPHIQSFVVNYIKKRMNKIKENGMKKIIQSADMIGKKDILSSIEFVKRDKSNDNTVIINAINNYICNLDNAKFLSFYNNTYNVNNTEEFKINDNITVKVSISSISHNDESDERDYTIQLYSYTIQLERLKLFVDDVVRKYMIEQNNKLGKQRYFFDEKPNIFIKDRYGNIQFEKSPNDLTFTMSSFNTNKSLKNVFGKHLEVVKDRVHTFMDNHEWYEKKGIPHTLGILLHGPPGTGKTSLIKAIAKDTNRHIFNIHLSDSTTKTQLKNLFFEEKITVLNNGRTHHYNIPLDERLYIIEDIDCLTDVVKTRESENKEQCEDGLNIQSSIENVVAYDPSVSSSNTIFNNSPISNINDGVTPKPFLKYKTRTHPEQLTLSFVLNLLDGILENPGRIIIMTTNHVDYLDSAFIRPGRIDINLEVGYCDENMIRDMFKHFYEETIPEEDYPINYINKITPAELNKIILDNYSNKENAWKELKNVVENHE
jgi:ATP-dependent Zn protease